MAFTPTQESDILAMLLAFTNGKTIAAMTAATTISEDESLEISQGGNSKKATLGLALSNRVKKFVLTGQTNIDGLYADGWYDVVMAAESAVNGYTTFGLAAFYNESSSTSIQVQFAPDNKIYMRATLDDGETFEAWSLVAKDLSEFTQDIADINEALGFKDGFYRRTNVTAADMDLYIQAGHHEVVTLNPPTNLINGASKFRLDVSKPDATTGEIIQIQTTTDGKIYHRSRSDAEAWTAWKLIASDVSNFTTDAELAVVVADEAAVAPQIAFNKRVVADGGTVRSKAFMQRVFEATKDLLADTELLFIPECGAKITDGKIEKLYNLVGTNDAVQATAANRPYVGGVIAPNEKAVIKLLKGNQNAALIHDAVSFTSAQAWTYILALDIDMDTNMNIGSAMAVRSDSIVLYLPSGTITAAGINHGSLNIIEIRYNNGSVGVRINGTSVACGISGATSASFSMVGAYSTDSSLKIKYASLISKEISAHESQSLHAFLSTEFPSIETIAVGSMQVATSNLEATVFGGTTVLEVQNAAGVELITNAADREFSSDTGFWTKGSGVTIESGVLKLTNAPESFVLVREGVLTVGKLYRIRFTASNDVNAFIGCASFPNPAYIANGQYDMTGVALFTSISLYGKGSLDIDNISIIEVGWSDLTTPAWCHYDNSAANGAIYGKLFNGYAVDTIKANAPQGFHVPSELEWTQLSETLGGNTVSGGKMKAKYGGFDNAFATNESGVSLLGEGSRSEAGVFSLMGVFGLPHTSEVLKVALVRSDINTFSLSGITKNEGHSIRLFSNTPNLEKLTYDSGWFATDIASSPKSIRIPFGCKVTNIKCITTTSVTAIEAKLFNYAGTELETLITGKACNATTKSFNVVADQTVSYTDNYVRVTATGNSGIGMTIYVTIEAI